MSLFHSPLFMMRLPILLFAVWVLHRGLVGQRTPFKLSRVPLGFIRLLAVIALFGLAGCASPEALPTAHGPLFALNPTHWQPTAQDLEAPPPVVNP